MVRCPASEMPVTAAKPLIGNDRGKATGSVCFSVGFCHHRKGLPVARHYRNRLPVAAVRLMLPRPAGSVEAQRTEATSQ